MNYKAYIKILVLNVLLISACSKKPEIENTSTYKMSKEWFVQTFEDGALALDFTKILTYNTSEPASSKIWIDDEHSIWPFKSKLDVDYPSLSFKPGAVGDNTYLSGESVKVVEGRVIPDGGHSRSGVLVDSLYIKLEFSDNPGVSYELKGHARTGFFEDEF